MRLIGRERRVGDDEAEHGRHVRRDHARAFGDPGDVVVAVGRRDRHERLLGARVGRHDAARGGVPVVAERVGGGLDTLRDLVHRQLRADHAGRHDDHLVRADAQRVCRQLRHLLGVGDALIAGAGIGAARVDRHRAQVIVILFEQFHVDQHGRGFDLVGREDRPPPYTGGR